MPLLLISCQSPDDLGLTLPGGSDLQEALAKEVPRGQWQNLDGRCACALERVDCGMRIAE